MAEQPNTTATQMMVITIIVDETVAGPLMLDPNPSFVELLGGDMHMAGSATGAQGPASNASIEALRVVGKEEEGKSEAECSICLELLFEENKGMLVKEMPCGHCYHASCIERWLQMHGTCPFCRYKMPWEEEEQQEETGNGFLFLIPHVEMN